jgi:hypothetical protein
MTHWPAVFGRRSRLSSPWWRCPDTARHDARSSGGTSGVGHHLPKSTGEKRCPQRKTEVIHVNHHAATPGCLTSRPETAANPGSGKQDAAKWVRLLANHLSSSGGKSRKGTARSGKRSVPCGQAASEIWMNCVRPAGSVHTLLDVDDSRAIELVGEMRGGRLNYGPENLYVPNPVYPSDGRIRQTGSCRMSRCAMILP